jgi:hypothetical protein
MKAFPSKRPVIKHLGKFGPIDFEPKIQDGMDLRDYFAAKALQGLLANPKLQEQILKMGGATSGWIEESAYSFADAMIKVREE